MNISVNGHSQASASHSPVVLKVSGSLADDEKYLEQLAATVGGMDRPVVIVHGGGGEIAALQRDLGIQPRYVEGLRATDEESLAIVEMVLSGRVNKRLVARLTVAGVQALGLSGVDLGLVRVEKMTHPAGDLGWVGEIVQVNPAPLQMLLQQGIVPVVSPVSLGFDGHSYNVNADHVATAVARALNASALYFLTNVAGVLADDHVISTLAASEVNELISNGTIYDGMVPKVRSAIGAVEAGVNEARITNLAGLVNDRGTSVVARERKRGA